MSRRSLKIAIATGVGALLIGGAAIGTALAQQTPTPPTPTGQASPQGQGPRALIERVAAKLGLPPDRVEQAFREARQELQTERGQRPGGPGRPGAPGRPGGPLGERFRGMLQEAMQIVANELHMTPEQLRSELPGSSIAAVARNHGVDPQVVANALISNANQRLDQAVAQGHLTADQAARFKQRIATMVPQLMERQLPPRPVR